MIYRRSNCISHLTNDFPSKSRKVFFFLTQTSLYQLFRREDPHQKVTRERVSTNEQNDNQESRFLLKT